MEDDLKKINARQPQKKMQDDLIIYVGLEVYPALLTKEIPPIPDTLSAGSLRPLNSAWAELSLGGGPPFYLCPGKVHMFHSILQSIQAADTEKMHGLLIVLIKLLWREM